jgi:hypothetical protein
MPYKSAAQQHIEDLQGQLRERDQQIANMMLERADDAVTAARGAAAAEQTAARQKASEEARKKAWVLHRFGVFATEHPTLHPPLDQIFSDAPADGSWPEGDGPRNWNLGPVADAAVAEVAEASVSDTKLGQMLADLEAASARLKQA